MVQFGSKHGECVVFRIGYQKGKVDQTVRIGELGDELEVVREERCSVLQGCQDQNSFVSDESLWARGNGVQVDMLNRGGFDFKRLMVVEENWCLHVGVP